MIFELSWGTYDSEQHWLFSHTDKSKEDFKRDCDELIVKYGDEYIDTADSWVGTDDWVEYVADKLSERGYEPVEPIAASYEGSMIIRDDDTEGKWAKLVGKRLIDKAIRSNFHQGIELWKDKFWFGVNHVYHRADCPLLLEQWDQLVLHIHYSVTDNSVWQDWYPCPDCKPEKP